MKLTSIRKNYDEFLGLLESFGINPLHNKYAYDREFFADNRILAEHILGDLVGIDHNRSIDENIMREVLRNNTNGSYNTEMEIDSIIASAKFSIEKFNAIVDAMVVKFNEDMVESVSVTDQPKYNLVSVMGQEEQYEHYSHFAIHKETGAVAWTYDYSGMYPQAPKIPADKTNKGAVTRYKNNLENFKFITKEVNDELNSEKETYFYIDLRDNIAPNYNVEKDFKVSDFAIVAKNNLKKYNIDLSNFNAFYGENNVTVSENIAPVELPLQEVMQPNIENAEVSETGRIYVHTEVVVNDVFNNNGGSPLKESSRDICVSETGDVIGEKRTLLVPDAQSKYYLKSDWGTGYTSLEDAEIVYFQYIDLAEQLEKEISSICRIAKNENEALTNASKLVYPQEASKLFFKKYYEVYGVVTPQEVVIQFFKNVNGIPDDSQSNVETPTMIVDEFQGENPFPYGIDSAGNKIQFTQEDVDTDGWLVASFKDLVSFIAPFTFNMHLDVSNNNLHALELLGNFNGMLNCSNNKLHSLKVPYRYNNYLNCSKNQLTEVSLSNHFNSELDCSFNLISVLDLTACNHFDRALNCNDNQITTLLLQPNFNNYLNASNNLLETYHVSDKFNSHLNLSNNRLSSLTFAGYFDAPLNVSNNILSDLKLPDGYNMDNLKAFGNVGKIEDAKFTFMLDKPLLKNKAVETLRKLTKYNGETIHIFELIESLDRHLPIAVTKMHSTKSVNGYVEKMTIGDLITNYKVEVDYYKYLEAGGVPLSVEVSRLSRIEEEQKIADEKASIVREQESNKALLAQNVAQKEQKDGMISLMLSTSNVNEIILKFTEGFIARLNQAKIERKSKSNDENIEYLENQIKVSSERAMKMFNTAHEIYDVMVSGGVPVKKFNYNIGDEVLFVSESGGKIVTRIEDIFTRTYAVEETYVIEKSDGIFNQYVNYDSLRPLK